MTTTDGQWSLERDGDRIMIVFRGYVRAQERDAQIARLKQLMRGDKVEFIAQFAELDRYDPALRIQWQKALWSHRQQITRVVVCSSNPIARMGVSAFALFMGTPCDVFTSLHDLDRFLSRPISA